MKVKNEHRNHCDGEYHTESRKIESRCYFKRVNGQWVWLCKDCWELQNNSLINGVAKWKGIDLQNL